MFVSVRFWRPEFEGYSGREYTYRTEMLLRAGDVVCAPTVHNPRNRAIVTGVSLEAPPFDCREITELWEEDGEPLPSAATRLTPPPEGEATGIIANCALRIANWEGGAR